MIIREGSESPMVYNSSLIGWDVPSQLALALDGLLRVLYDLFLT